MRRKDPAESQGAPVASVARTSDAAPAEGDGAPVASVARTSDAAVLRPQVVLDKGCFALAAVAQIVDRDAHSSQGFPGPGDVELEDGRNFFT